MFMEDILSVCSIAFSTFGRTAEVSTHEPQFVAILRRYLIFIIAVCDDVKDDYLA